MGNRTRKCKSQNPYIRLLCKLYKFMARRTDSKFNKVIFKRLNMSGRNKVPVSLSKLASNMENKDGKVACVVGTITDDKRLFDVPKLSVCALRFTESARARILKAGGECLTFGKLALRSPLGQGTVLLRGPVKARKAGRRASPTPAQHPMSAPRAASLKKHVVAGNLVASRCELDGQNAEVSM